MKRLLLLGCSATKRADAGLLPAIERYDGPVYRVIRAYRAEGHRLPAILILSAAHGLITPSHGLPNYDTKMSDRHAAAWKQSLPDRHALRLAWWRARDRFLCCGALYREVFHALAPRFDDTTPPNLAEEIEPQYTAATGGIGDQLGQLKHWLHCGHNL